MGFVGNLVLFPVLKEFRNYIKNWQSYSISLVRYFFWTQCTFVLSNYVLLYLLTRGQSNLTKSASRGAHSPVRGHPRGSKVVPLNSWGRVSY